MVLLAGLLIIQEMLNFRYILGAHITRISDLDIHIPVFREDPDTDPAFGGNPGSVLHSIFDNRLYDKPRDFDPQQLFIHIFGYGEPLPHSLRDNVKIGIHIFHLFPQSYRLLILTIQRGIEHR